MHLNNFDQQDWIRRHFEAPHVTELTPEQKKVLFKRLIRSTRFEEFLAKKWPSEKRFGLEGCEVLIPAIKQVLDRSSSLGIDSAVIGMPHRGLNHNRCFPNFLFLLWFRPTKRAFKCVSSAINCHVFPIQHLRACWWGIRWCQIPSRCVYWTLQSSITAKYKNSTSCKSITSWRFPTRFVLEILYKLWIYYSCRPCCSRKASCWSFLQQRYQMWPTFGFGSSWGRFIFWTRCSNGNV